MLLVLFRHLGLYFKYTVKIVTHSQYSETSYVEAHNFLPSVFYQSGSTEGYSHYLLQIPSRCRQEIWPAYDSGQP